MERPKLYFLQRFHQKPKKSYILLMGVNVMREIISFLNYTEYIEFCITCKKFIKFLSDRFIAFTPVFSPALFDDNASFVLSMNEHKFIELLKKGVVAAVNVEWKIFQVSFFHFVLFESRKLVFFFHERGFEIKELLAFSTDLRPTISKSFKDAIIYARGYKNQIIISFRDRIEHIYLSSTNILLNEDDSNSTTYSYLYPKEERAPYSIEFINSGRNVLVAFREAVYLLSHKLNLLNIHRYKGNPYKLIIPSVQGKSYVAYTSKEITIYKLNTSQEIKVVMERTIAYLLLAHFSNSPKLVYSNDLGDLFINKTPLKLRSDGEIYAVKEFLIYRDYSIQDKVVIWDMITKTPKLEFRMLSNEPHTIIHCTAFKLFYIQDNKIHLYSFLNRSVHFIHNPFEILISTCFIYTFLFITGKIGPNYGLIVYDFTRDAPFSSLQKYLEAPLRLEPRS